MSPDPYASCPCGSGKKFKWCCQEIMGPIDRAFDLDAQGQHEAAHRAMDQVTKQHADNPEAWGKQAELLARNGKVDEAEAALGRAFALNPNYPYGHLLRAQLRLMEGELIGGLLLLRKAAEHYAVDALEPLTVVYQMILDAESQRNNPVAARAALQQLLRLQPANADLRQAYDAMFGERSRMPLAARRDYRLMPAAAAVAPDQKREWDARLNQAATGRLADCRQAFEVLTKQFPADPAAWFNLGLACAWLGDNRAALEALDQYVNLEPDEGKAAEAGALGEVLRCGGGVEDLADVVGHRVTFQMRDPQAVVSVLQNLEAQQRLTIDRVDQEQGIVSGRILETPALTLSTPGGTLVPLAASVLMVQDVLQLRSVNADAVRKVAAELQKPLADRLSPPREDTTYAHFGEVILPALAFPFGPINAEDYERKLHDYTARYFEEVWVHRPLKVLRGVPPIDAAGSPTLRKRLLGVILFLHDCLAASSPRVSEDGKTPIAAVALYDFDRLRHKLNLHGAAPAAAATAKPDFGRLNAAELAALAPDGLDAEDLEKAFRAALKLDARDLAGWFARALVSRPANPDKGDRFAFYNHLVQMRLGEGDAAGALALLDQATAADAEQNGGQRRNDYDLKRGQILAKRGDADAAEAAFAGAIERSGGDPKFLGTATEALLGARQGAKALKFAEQGLAVARARNNRDLEQYFLELVSAAQKQK